MDQLASTNIHTLHNCILHPQNKVAFIQINGISNQPNSSIFQCVNCFEQDLQFRGANHMLIQSIIETQQSDFHYKWPPLNDQQIIQKIHLKANSLNSTQAILDQINSYFSKLKDEINQKIDIALKKALNQALEMPFGKDQILQRYQEISQIKSLRSTLVQGQNKSFDLYQQSCKDFIQQIELQKDRNTQLLQELLNECNKVQELANFDKLNQSKQLLLDFLDTLNVFEHKTESQINLNDQIDSIQSQQKGNSKLDKLMQLISNKTNYCSQEFLNEIRQQLQKLSLFLEQISFDKMNQENKKVVRFSELNDEKINNVNEYVEHLINMQNNIQYVESVKNSHQIQKLQSVLDNKFNFINQNYQENLMKYLIETYPFQKNLNTDQIHSEEQSFNIVKSLETNYIKNFIQLIKKKQNFDENQQNFRNSQTQKVQQEIIKQFNYEQNELENILKMYPIFDLIEFKDQQSIMNELQFYKSNYNDGNQRIEIVKNMNNQFEIYINEYNYQGQNKGYATNCISQKLKRDKKYIFRIQFKKGDGEKFLIGLMQNKNFNSNSGFYDATSYYFKIQNNKMKYIGGHGIDKFVKGNSEQLLDENSTLELRVWLEGQQLEVLDYPNYSYQVQIKDEFKQNLLQNDLCLYFYLAKNQDKYILVEAI